MINMNLGKKTCGIIVLVFAGMVLFLDAAEAQVKVPESAASSKLKITDKEDEWFESLFKSYPGKCDSLLANRSKYN